MDPLLDFFSFASEPISQILDVIVERVPPGWVHVSTPDLTAAGGGRTPVEAFAECLAAPAGPL